jgi:carbamate kinase
MIQQSLQNALERAGLPREVITVVTQTVVAPDDPALGHPTKFIGHHLTVERKDRLAASGVAVGQDKGGTWRRLTASPIPIGIVESDSIRRLVEAGSIVVTCGGGGPPVYRDPLLGWEGVDAVVDKDRTAAILARTLKAEILLILTDIEAVFRDFGTPSATAIRRMTVTEAEAMVAAGELGTGSMRPKVEAGISFVRSGGNRAVIAELGSGPAALRGETGTTIVAEGQ